MNEEEVPEFNLMLLETFARRAYEASSDAPHESWDELAEHVRLSWCRVADAVLDEYDPEYAHDKWGW